MLRHIGLNHSHTFTSTSHTFASDQRVTLVASCALCVFLSFLLQSVITSRLLWLRMHIRAKKVSDWIRWILHGERWTRSVRNRRSCLELRVFAVVARQSERQKPNQNIRIVWSWYQSYKKQKQSCFWGFSSCKTKSKNHLVAATTKNTHNGQRLMRTQNRNKKLLTIFYRFSMSFVKFALVWMHRRRQPNAIRLK